MTVTVGTVLKVVCTLVHLDTGVIQNVFNAVVGGSGGPFDDADITEDLNTWVEDIYSEILDMVSEDITASETTSYEYDTGDDDWDELGSEVPSLIFTRTEDLLPRGVALLINAKTTDPDVNGKKYFGGLTEVYWDGTAWNVALFTQMADLSLIWGTEFVGAASGATITPAIWSPTRLAAYPLTGTFVMPVVAAYQRRRKPGVGI